MHALMQNTVSAATGCFANFSIPTSVPNADANDCRAAYLRQADSEFVQMLNGFRSSGGLARLSEVVALSERRGSLDIAALSGSLARRELICFEWQSEGWLPLFQFDPLDMTIRSASSCFTRA